MVDEHKACTTCLAVMPISQFRVRVGLAPGTRYGKCISCTKQYLKDRADKNIAKNVLTPRDSFSKKCAVCNQVKDSSMFARLLSNPDGHCRFCRECAKQKTRKVKESGRMAKYAVSAKKASPMKTAARAAVRDALRIGKLVRQPCVRCGGEDSNAHHEDYSKPLDVMWLCKAHHADRHMEIKNEQRSELVAVWAGRI